MLDDRRLCVRRAQWLARGEGTGQKRDCPSTHERLLLVQIETEPLLALHERHSSKAEERRRRHGVVASDVPYTGGSDLAEDTSAGWDGAKQRLAGHPVRRSQTQRIHDGRRDVN